MCPERVRGSPPPGPGWTEARHPIWPCTGAPGPLGGRGGRPELLPGLSAGRAGLGGGAPSRGASVPWGAAGLALSGSGGCAAAAAIFGPSCPRCCRPESGRVGSGRAGPSPATDRPNERPTLSGRRPTCSRAWARALGTSAPGAVHHTSGLGLWGGFLPALCTPFPHSSCLFFILSPSPNPGFGTTRFLSDSLEEDIVSVCPGRGQAPLQKCLPQLKLFKTFFFILGGLLNWEVIASLCVSPHPRRMLLAPRPPPPPRALARTCKRLKQLTGPTWASCDV